MNKKICALLLTLILTVSSIMTSFAQEVSNVSDIPKLEGSSALLMETKYGQIVYEKDDHKRRHPASVTKIMTVAVAFDIIKEKGIPLDDMVKVSKKAAAVKGASIKLKEGDLISIDSLLDAIIMNSANNACVVLAEYLGSSESLFIEKMNKKAESLGLKDTNFVSVNGLTWNKAHYSSAYDISIIASELIKEGDIFRYTLTPTKDINIYRENKKEPVRTIKLESTNKLLGKYQGIDGMKTGWVGPESGYCFVGTANREDTRLLSITLGAQKEHGNFRDTVKLLDYGFNNYTYIPFIEEDETVLKTKVEGSLKSLKVTLGEELTIFGKYPKEDYKTKVNTDKLELPIKKGDKVGTLEIYAKDKLIMKKDVFAQNNVKKSVIISIIEKFKNLI